MPVLGVNMGWLGFLTEIEKPEDCPAGLDQLLAGDFWIEKRMMLQATLLEYRTEVVGSYRALNDMVISGSVFGRMVQIAAYIDKHWATTYNADALIVSDTDRILCLCAGDGRPHPATGIAQYSDGAHGAPSEHGTPDCAVARRGR